MLQSLYNSVSAVLVLLLLTGLGYCLGRAGWLDGGSKRFLNRFIINIAVPCMCVNGLLKNLTHDELSAAAVMVCSAFAGIGLSLVLSLALARLLRVPRQRAGVFVAMGGLSNCIFVGVPLTTELFGSDCIPYLMIYYLANTTLVQTVGLAAIRRSGLEEGERPGPAAVLLDLLRRPPVLAVLAGVGMLLLDLRLPRVLMSATGYISGSVSPLALIYCGYLIYELGLKNLRLDATLAAMLVMRFLVSPAICLLMCRLTGITGLARSVFAVASALPVVSQVPVLAGALGADEHYAAQGMALSTLACFVVIPVLMLLL